MQVNHIELKEQIKISYETKIPLFVMGATGIGKSDTIVTACKELAESNGLEFSDKDIQDGKFGFVDVRISQLDSTDLRGLPSVEEGKTKWLIPNWLPSNKESKGILFFDELNLAPPSIQSACYQLILDRKLGDYELPKGWLIVSAGNRVEDKCNVFEMSSALKNRFAHTELKIPDHEAWTNWALNNDLDGRVVAFIQFKPSSLFKFDVKNSDNAFPTPRSWTFCSRLIRERENKELLQRLASSTIGEATATEFVGFLKLQKKINLKEILSKPELVASIKEIDLKYVLLGTISEYYKKDKSILLKTLKLCEYLEPEFAILLLRFLKGVNKKHFSSELIKSKEGKELLTRYAEILN